ncbi:hypothetical protein GCM10023194_27650 [Planotetraspora phitsanulokensis]|uniref:Uncharacterized protein n=1 Tax=Planotetraspora phitsanulokensis TaxID=575192 RepID=A0A8J3TZY8_9ACTN|nr:hypothetical protein Pph01_11010 [Planotetraspora phitsanulokensis]
MTHASSGRRVTANIRCCPPGHPDIRRSSRHMGQKAYLAQYKPQHGRGVGDAAVAAFRPTPTHRGHLHMPCSAHPNVGEFAAGYARAPEGFKRHFLGLCDGCRSRWASWRCSLPGEGNPSAHRFRYSG